MLIFKNILICSFLLLCLFNSFAQKTVKFKLSDIEKTRLIEGKKLDLREPLKNPHEIILADSLLLLKNLNSSPVVDVINLKSGKIINQFCKRGRGPGEIISPVSIQYISGAKNIMVQDINGKKMVIYDLNNVLNDADKNYINTVNITEDILVRKVVRKGDGNFFCDLIGHTDDYMNCLIDESGELIKFVSKYPQIDVEYDPVVASNIFDTNIGACSNGNYVIIAYRFSDKISIFDKSNKHVVDIMGPNYSKLHVVIRNDRASLTSKNNRAYNIPCGGDKLFMIPYSGKPRVGPISNAEDILCFDYEGNIVCHFVVKPRVTEIAVDWENRIIYGVNKDLEPAVYKYNFEL